MTKRTWEIREFLLRNTPQFPADIIQQAALFFGISRQAVHRHMRGLIEEGLVQATGNTRQRTYALVVLFADRIVRQIAGLQEDEFWRSEVHPRLHELPGNVLDIWHYGFTEMVNNAVDHSEGSSIGVGINRTALSTTMWISDDGVGVFRKIQSALGLEDERHAVLELSKGKLTTDPERHTGEGIFFSSRVFDDYAIFSGDVHFSHQTDRDDDWIFETSSCFDGTIVLMEIEDRSPRTLKSVFDKFTSKGGTLGFTRTVVPVRLLRYGLEKLVSRSQAKRLLARFDRFSVVTLDFAEVEEIGQAFADEIFRVFPSQVPSVRIAPVNMTDAVKFMIKRVRGH